MTYTILKTGADELQVRLGDGQFARVRIMRRVLQNSGCLHIAAAATQTDENGCVCVDAGGRPIQSAFGHTMSAEDSGSADIVSATIRSIVAVVLGEDPEIETWRDDIHAECNRHANLRSHIGAHTHAASPLAGIFER